MNGGSVIVGYVERCGVKMNWLCVHGHTAEAHPQCWRRYKKEAELGRYVDLDIYTGGEKKTTSEKEKTTKWINAGYASLTKSGKMIKLSLNKGTVSDPIWENYFVFSDATKDLLENKADRIWIREPIEVLE